MNSIQSIQKIEIFENEKHRTDKGIDSTLKIALLAFGFPGLVMLLIMCLILPSKIEYVAKGEPVKAELISVSDKGSRFSFYYNEKKYEIHPGVRRKLGRYARHYPFQIKEDVSVDSSPY